MKVLKKICRALVDFADGWVARLLAVGAVTVSSATAKMYGDATFKAYLPRFVVDIYFDHPWCLLIADWVPIPALLIALILSGVKHKLAANQPGSRSLLCLLDSIAMAVGKKLEARHHKACLMVGHGELPNKPIYSSSPSDQMKVLVDGLHKVFQLEATSRGMPPEAQIKVTLVEMNQMGKFERFWYYFPANLGPSSPEKFKTTRSFFQVAVEKDNIVVLRDIATELKKTKGDSRYLSSQPAGDDAGSIIAWPIRIKSIKGHPDIPLVLAIKCDTENIFNDDRIDLYRLLITPFADRIKLEFYNHIIYGRSEEPYGNNPATPGKNNGGANKGSSRAKKADRSSAESSTAD